MNRDEPKPEKTRPGKPGRLSAGGKSAWNEALGIAEQMGVLTEADGIALEFLAEAIADLRAARASLARAMTFGEPDNFVTLAKPGERYYWTVGKSGPMRRQRPELADIADADRRVSLWVARFGLSPADRTRVGATKKKQTNPFADLG